MFPDGRVKRTTTPELARACVRFGCKHVGDAHTRLRKHEDYRDLAFDAILRVDGTEDNRGGHWVVWDSVDKCVRDPEQETPKEYNCKSYLQAIRAKDRRIWPWV